MNVLDATEIAYKNGYKKGKDDAMRDSDFVEVVRCKDCGYWQRNAGLFDSPNGQCFYHDICTNGTNFCSYGERKTP